VTNMVGEVLTAFGTEETRRTFVPRLCDGTLRAGSFALSEAEAGSDPGAMRTTAKRDGDEWVIDGSKMWITSGDFAGVFVVWARTGDAGPKGISAFAVPSDTPGLSVGRHEEKMGLRGSPTTGPHFEGCRVPAHALLGELNGGFKIAMMALDGGRIGIASQALGIATCAYDAAVAHLRATPADQGEQFRLADMATRIEASRSLALRAASMKERGEPFSREASIAKAFATEGAWATCNTAVEIVGDDALTLGHPAERALRDVRVTMIYEGTSEVQRVVVSRLELR
ncbi:MAG: acyl-CoA dehydrogenase family protein, partial [Myxococcales bacterium]|nr:acyl-CoA dehydrogenase family protein [Myxococcales bacterium]